MHLKKVNTRIQNAVLMIPHTPIKFRICVMYTKRSPDGYVLFENRPVFSQVIIFCPCTQALLLEVSRNNYDGYNVHNYCEIFTKYL